MFLTRDDQKNLVKNLTESIVASILEQIDKGLIPAGWDGHELRELLAERFDWERSRLMKDSRRRMREYRNTVLVNNL